LAHARYPKYSGGRDEEDHCSKPALGKQFMRPCLENTQYKKRADEVAYVVEHLTSKCEALSSSPRTTKKIEFIFTMDAKSSIKL
jgi:hypothetical protein